MRRLAVIGGIGMMTFAGTNMIWHKQKLDFNPNTLAPAKAGIANKKEILLESNLLNLKIRAAVIVIPALLTPGINESIWNRPI